MTIRRKHFHMIFLLRFWLTVLGSSSNKIEEYLAGCIAGGTEEVVGSEVCPILDQPGVCLAAGFANEGSKTFGSDMRGIVGLNGDEEERRERLCIVDMSDGRGVTPRGFLFTESLTDVWGVHAASADHLDEVVGAAAPGDNAAEIGRFHPCAAQRTGIEAHKRHEMAACGMAHYNNLFGRAAVFGNMAVDPFNCSGDIVYMVGMYGRRREPVVCAYEDDTIFIEELWLVADIGLIALGPFAAVDEDYNRRVGDAAWSIDVEFLQGLGTVGNVKVSYGIVGQYRGLRGLAGLNASSRSTGAGGRRSDMRRILCATCHEDNNCQYKFFHFVRLYEFLFFYTVLNGNIYATDIKGVKNKSMLYL